MTIAGRTMIRKAKARDMSTCLPLLTSLYHGDIGVDFKSVFESYIIGHNTTVLLAQSKDGVIGILIGSYQMDIDWEGMTAKIDAIIVDKKHRRTGIAKQLVHRFILLAKERKCKAVKSRVNRMNAEAQKFHESLGFAKADTYEYVVQV